MNITVPQGLKERMDRIDGVNWSEVARTAFLRKLAQLEAQKDEPTMEEVMARLLATREECEEKAMADGEALGRQWAKKVATWDGLEALADEEIFDGEPLAPYSRLDLLFMAVKRWDDDKDGRPGDASAAWWRDEVRGPHDPSETMLGGFAEGALNVWSEVQERL